MNKLSDRLPWRAPRCLNAVRQDDIARPGKTPLSRTWRPVDPWPEGFHPLNRHHGHPSTPSRPPPPPAGLRLCSWPPESLRLQPRPPCPKLALTVSWGPPGCAVRFKCAQLSALTSPLSTWSVGRTPPTGLSPRPPELCPQAPARPLTAVQSPHTQHTQLWSPPPPYSHLKAAPPPQPRSLLPGQRIIC